MRTKSKKLAHIRLFTMGVFTMNIYEIYNEGVEKDIENDVD